MKYIIKIEVHFVRDKDGIKLEK